MNLHLISQRELQITVQEINSISDVVLENSIKIMEISMLMK